MKKIDKIKISLFLKSISIAPITNLLRRLIWVNETIFWEYKKIRNRGKYDDPFDYWLDGYPRSGNTFLKFCLLNYFHEKVLMAHVHAPHLPLLGIKKNIPGILLIRDPLDAVVSYHLRTKHSIDTSLKYYIDYHLKLKRHLAQLFISEFKFHSQNPILVFKRFLQFYSLDSWENKDFTSETLKKKSLSDIEKIMDNKFGGESMDNFISKPNRNRKEQADKLKKSINSSNYYNKNLNKAYNLYDTFKKRAEELGNVVE